MHDMRRRGNGINKRTKIASSANCFQMAHFLQLIRQTQKINRLSLFKKSQYAGKNQLMSPVIKIFRTKKINNPIDRLFVQQNRAESGFFGFDILGRKLIGIKNLRWFWHMSGLSP